ncbi:hypothetical protein J2T12_001377 [Paenibacillus anaericanus]|uniref:Uncharacterized protein n=1 Tax=Paenibacillus anaericanus TaxID=170367 RepID=A0A3S1BRY0_9BACL|nr:hypothetical protein [Paenibacillus anaericanus]MDQ0087971.1 hypothetical protein [Paenibacillus anaericanus]RUT48286.1 hypothetical protein EJP82_03930 [Paenibacillus anaericanus]
MIMIGLTFALIMLLEWYIMRKQRKEPRSIRIVLIISLCFLILLEVQYVFQYRYNIPLALKLCSDYFRGWIPGN